LLAGEGTPPPGRDKASPESRAELKQEGKEKKIEKKKKSKE